MPRFWAWWLRKVIKNEFRPTFLYWFFFRESYDRHWQRRVELWRKNTERNVNG